MCLQILLQCGESIVLAAISQDQNHRSVQKKAIIDQNPKCYLETT